MKELEVIAKLLMIIRQNSV